LIVSEDYDYFVYRTYLYTKRVRIDRGYNMVSVVNYKEDDA